MIARTEGNPFFLEESVRTLVETGVLVGERGAYRLAQAVESLQVPVTVQAVLAARIDRLAPEDKRLLQTAAVIGTEVPWLLFQAIAERPKRRCTGAWGNSKLPSSSTKPASSPSMPTPSSTPSRTKWPTAAFSRSGGGCSMPGLSRPWRRSQARVAEVASGRASRPGPG